MNDAPTGGLELLAHVPTAAGSVKLVEYYFSGPANGHLSGDGKFRIELSLTARHRSARACFRDQWPPHRFERIGDMFIVHPEADLIAKSDEASNITAIVCELDAQPVMDLMGCVPAPSSRLLTASLDVRNERARTLLMWMAEEARRPDFASQALVEMMCGHLALELVRHGDAVREAERSGGLTAWRLRLIEERLNEPGPAPSVADLAALCRLSVRQLARGFRASRGCSLSVHIAQRQIESAKAMLAAGDSVASIGARLGFSSSSSFCFAFRRETGLSPNAYRQRLL